MVAGKDPSMIDLEDMKKALEKCAGSAERGQRLYDGHLWREA
jgi:hypothetical protein